MTMLLIGLYVCVTLCWGTFVLASVHGETGMSAWQYMLLPFVILLWPVLAVVGALLILFIPTKSLMEWMINK